MPCSHRRFERYKPATTIAEYLKLGGTHADFRYDFARAYISVDWASIPTDLATQIKSRKLVASAGRFAMLLSSLIFELSISLKRTQAIVACELVIIECKATTKEKEIEPPALRNPLPFVLRASQPLTQANANPHTHLS